MAYSKQKIKSKAEGFQTSDSMALAASTLGKDASEDEVRDAVAKVVSQMLDSLPTIITWWISDDFAAKLVARVLDAVGQTILKWLR